MRQSVAQAIASSPWKFTNNPWERSFERWQLTILLGKAPLIALAAFPFQIAVYGIPKWSRVEATRLVLPCCGIGILLWGLWTGGHGTKAGDKRKTQLFQVAVRMLLFGASHGIIFGEADDIGQLERSLRWIIIAALGMGTFEEQLIWSGCVLGSRVMYEHFTEAVSNSIGIWILFSCHVLLMRNVYAFRRREWRRILATTTFTGILSSDYSAEKLSGAPVQQDWHDDYFPESEWKQVAPVIEREGEEMVKRGSDTHRVQSYDWIHTYKRLGEGAYGVVRVVKSRTTGEIRAMKIARAHRGGGAEAGAGKPRKEKMTSEAVLLRMLQHPNVVGFIEEVALEHEAHLVMELCDGGSLAQLISTFGALDLGAAKWFTRNIVQGLQYLHRHGISHQDLKPGNCLLTREGGSVLLKLADFGLGSWKAGSRESSKVVGTPEYIAPETGSRSASRRRMDIWALGVCALEMVTARTLIDLAGEHAQLNNQPAAVIKHLQALRHDPRLPRDVPRGEPLAFISACLRVQPALRPTAFALDPHPFISLSACPTDAPSIAVVLRRPLLDIQEGDLDETMLLPRLRRHATLWLNPWALWLLLTELEEPFLNPEREGRFLRWMAQDARYEWVAAIGSPVHLALLVQQINAGWANGTPVDAGTYGIAAVCSVFFAFFWAPRSMRLAHLSKIVFLMRLLRAMRLLAPWPQTGMVFTPVYFFLVFCSGWLTPNLAELILWCAVITLKILAQLGWQLLEDWGRSTAACAGDKAATCASGLYSSPVPTDSLDRTASAVIVVIFCASLCAYASFFVRLERRHHFRRLTKLKLVKANGEERQAGESVSSHSSQSRSQSPKREPRHSPFEFPSDLPSPPRISPRRDLRAGRVPLKVSPPNSRDCDSGSPRREGSSGSTAGPTNARTSEAPRPRRRPGTNAEEPVAGGGRGGGGRGAGSEAVATATAETVLSEATKEGPGSKASRRRDRQEHSARGYLELASSDAILGAAAALGSSTDDQAREV